MTSTTAAVSQRQQPAQSRRPRSKERQTRPQEFQIGTPVKQPTKGDPEPVILSPSETPYFCRVCTTPRWPHDARRCKKCGVKFSEVPPQAGGKGQTVPLDAPRRDEGEARAGKGISVGFLNESSSVEQREAEKPLKTPPARRPKPSSH